MRNQWNEAIKSIVVFWVVTLCNLVCGYQRLRGTFLATNNTGSQTFQSWVYIFPFLSTCRPPGHAWKFIETSWHFIKMVLTYYRKQVYILLSNFLKQTCLLFLLIINWKLNILLGGNHFLSLQKIKESVSQGLYLKSFIRSQLTHRPDDGGSKDLWNVGKLLPDYTALQPKRQPFSLWRQYVSPKLWHLPTSLHGAKTQNNNIVILTAVKTSNLKTVKVPKTIELWQDQVQIVRKLYNDTVAAAEVG
jgi:hypothetical protein